MKTPKVTILELLTGPYFEYPTVTNRFIHLAVTRKYHDLIKQGIDQERITEILKNEIKKGRLK
jgi:hypothetical protein